jgi:hypothetical protein
LAAANKASDLQLAHQEQANIGHPWKEKLQKDTKNNYS